MTGASGVAAVEAVWRIESARLVAGLARLTGDVGTAEELAQDALVAALERWPVDGVPPNPGGWLMTTAKNRAVDGFRRAAVHRRAVEVIGRDATDVVDARDAVDDALDDPVGDDVLRLLFTACHPALHRDHRVALTLRCLSGLRTDEIARAFLVPGTVAGQRVSRAKKALRDKGIRFAMPAPEELVERLASVLEVIYLVFNEGYSATAGEDWMRPELCAEALRLARLTASLVPGQAEAHGLAALLELTQARAAARHDADGRPVLLQHQDRRRWDALLVRRGLAALARAAEVGGIGPYTLQAAVAACHATARTAAETDRAQIAALYDVLAAGWPSPVVALNRAMAHGYASGPEAGLALFDEVVAVQEHAAALAAYPQRPAVHGELLAMAGRHAEAADRFVEAAALTRNGPERALFAARAAEAAAAHAPESGRDR
ncbi:RNA polymerase subunit sigma-24 [Pseudonocardia sp. KRD-184]|uniref:RNA polymerase subunit sigma-24 n=1 Tax=Pseudonocardia oceani TaxID=2792013 RepID=A0ABS6UDV2_9PSEU|nr:DUF6596 domain-containing protein [Pseudonocardia oceani]MBW0093631.1 RNA polymerase subunit sigma-24 [Pseudonocardia oceani]MBW0094412.1 RNA polymerase subunit sigma-24 [Pseudonocardia oceani]MBW0107925.1 RNA polymerase subunit sigma-24 [Pseudonocardia oceani]MBW0119981.1 RNA polymerase subunit sigma-24 [Pseudonocardia oceani]MBW0130061.1 RNA polymerase subunit sigma-24 [Pseudonocardia oceani]